MEGGRYAPPNAGYPDMIRFLSCIDTLSTWIGKAFAWLILVLTLGISYEVFVRYVLRAPTTWAFDFSYITYGALFLMAGGYTLVRNQHVRADVLYRFWRPRTQAMMDLLLYFLFFFPAVARLDLCRLELCAVLRAVSRSKHLQSRGHSGFPA